MKKMKDCAKIANLWPQIKNKINFISILGEQTSILSSYVSILCIQVSILHTW